ncbi:MAG: aldo/keto reductase [Defluviitaleaceae bacterium]|nr:aldo/keto reductase [Defluviitaleaceae bacterium]
MKYAILNNGIIMPLLGFGVYGLAEGPQCTDTVRYAIEAGYRSIDTASGYDNEASVGQAIRESGVPRDDIFLTTKLGNGDQRSGNVQEAFDISLSRLGLDYVDLYIIHWPCAGYYEKAWLALERIYKSGKARAVGVSNFHPHHIEDIKKAWTITPALNQVEMHPFLTQKPLITFCRENNIAPQAWSPLGGNRPLQERIFANEAIKRLAEKYGKSPAQIVLRWNIELGVITIPKSANPSRIKENFDIFDFELTAEEVADIDALNRDERGGPDPDNFNF